MLKKADLMANLLTIQPPQPRLFLAVGEYEWKVLKMMTCLSPWMTLGTLKTIF